MSCPIKQTARDHFDRVEVQHRKATGEGLRLHIPMGCRSEDPYEDLANAKSVAELPGIIASMGFGDFMTLDFFKKFVEPGHFKSFQTKPVHPDFANAGLVDPRGWYTVYSVWAHVLLVDTGKLGGLPVPRRWEDLLSPCYAGQIVSDGAHDQRFSPTVLLQFYKDHGEEGVARLAANIREAWHPATMVKTAGSADSRGAAIYIVPWSFARARQWTPHVKLIWPEDGAIASPLYALRRESGSPAVQAAAQALTGAELGQQCARAGFPVLNAAVDNFLPYQAGFRWLGWDYLRHNNVKDLIPLTAAIAEQAWLGKAA